MNNNAQENRDAKGCLICLLLFILAAAGLCWIGHMNADKDREYCELMESKNAFSDKEKEWLYHWMNPGKYDDHHPSDRFIELYNKKVK